MNTPDDGLEPSTQAAQPGGITTSSPASAVSPVADSAMATGTDDEPEMTIADKHVGDAPLDPDGDGELTTDEAAALLGDADAARSNE